MQILNIFRKHERYALMATAYADGELAAAEHSRFEAHIATCSDCAGRVQAARAIKASVAALPAVAPTRSFLLTPAMVGQVAPQPFRDVRPTRVPAYLAVARVAAGLSVVAFVSVFAASLLDGSSSDQQATSERLASGAEGPVSDSALAPDPGANATDKSADATPVPGLAPASGGAVEGQGFATQVASSPVPPERNAADAATPSAGDSTFSEATGQPGVLGDPLEVAYDVDADQSAEGNFPWVIVLGSFAGAMVGLLYVFETKRRKRA